MDIVICTYLQICVMSLYNTRLFNQVYVSLKHFKQIVVYNTVASYVAILHTSLPDLVCKYLNDVSSETTS